MLLYQHGDITKITEGIVVHGVNCQGKMASGVAKAIRATWPKAYDAYMHAYEMELQTNGRTTGLLGKLQGVKVTDSVLVCNAFTQEYYGKDKRRYVNYDALAWCFGSLSDIFYDNVLYKDIKREVYIPMIGAGLGGGDWKVISTIIQSECKFPITCIVPDFAIMRQMQMEGYQTIDTQT